MPATDYQNPPFSFGRTIMRRYQVHSVESATSHDPELESFQRQTADRFNSLSSVPTDALLSLSWVREVLDAFLCCQEEFQMLLCNNKQSLNKPQTDRLISEYFERSVKALDVCNAIRDGIEHVRQWEKQLEIVICALVPENNKSLSQGHFRRARKALIDLTICMLGEKDSNPALTHRNRSFGRCHNVKKESRNLGHFRSLSWSVSPSWSASKQLQAIGNSAIPKTNDGLAIAVFTMSSVLYFTMWVLVAAIPCQDRGLHTHFNVPKHFVWAGPILSIHDRVLEESKKRDRRNACGLMREIHRIEACVRVMNEMMTDEREGEVRERAEELREALGAVKEGFGPLENGVREAFRGIVRIRTEGLESLNRS